MNERVIRRVTIHGRVQGVGFRDWTRHVARGRGIEGWVRNLKNGCVEAVFAGTHEAVSAMVAACRGGPSGAKVERIDEHNATDAELDLRRPNEGFSVIATA